MVFYQVSGCLNGCFEWMLKPQRQPLSGRYERWIGGVRVDDDLSGDGQH